MDTGLATLIALAKYYQIDANPQKLQHLYGLANKSFDDIRLLQAATSLSLKAKNMEISLSSLKPANLPCIAKAKGGTYFILAKVAKDETGKISSILVHDLRNQKPEVLELADFEQLWSGHVILIAKDTNFAESLAKKFDISWFLPSLVKYRQHFREVLIASFILQLFTLVTPFFFQVVMDKVVVHRGFSTLNVLAVGFLIAVVFEAFMGGFRNYLFSHTTNRVDIELGARLYNHLLALPLPYFESRQVGQNVARVRELDTIRNFITGTALTLVIYCLCFCL